MALEKACSHRRPKGSGHRARPRRRWGSFASLVFLVLLGCTTPLTVSEEKTLGAQATRQVKEQVKLVTDPVIVGYVADIGNRIVLSSGPQPYDFEFYVVEGETINAFAVPAGSIFIHTETILQVRNVSELAGVMGHEVGHVLRRHIANNYRRQQSVSIARDFGVLAAEVFGGAAAGQMAGMGGGLAASAYLNTFSRDAERDADQFAIMSLPRAGYDPMGLVTFFEVLQADQSGPGVPEFLRSHPTTSERLENARALIATIPGRGDLIVSDGGKLNQVQRRLHTLLP